MKKIHTGSDIGKDIDMIQENSKVLYKKNNAPGIRDTPYREASPMTSSTGQWSDPMIS